MAIWKRIILFGDSITQYSTFTRGWETYVHELVQRKCDIFNRGFSGYNTDFAVKIQESVLSEHLLHDVAFATIFFGANDAALPEYSSEHHVPVERYEMNLNKIVDNFKKMDLDADKIIIISPPPVDEKAHLQNTIAKGNGNVSDRSNDVTKTYGQASARVAKARGCRHIDLWQTMMSTDNYSKYLSDGLHLSDEGNKLLGKCLEPHVRELTQHLPVMLPQWRDFKLSNFK
ncbi:isoamyl acetate-hydrolyzing esterase 1 homolog [Clavelina lepadiformis]|uniref:1-alkyl-2-acetylglycerophosphocholine esterase n=1 Tax=Clavelina lepadiformis TaxID=159417 RepID=A0ABP0FB00_CLALP